MWRPLPAQPFLPELPDVVRGEAQPLLQVHEGDCS